MEFNRKVSSVPSWKAQRKEMHVILNQKLKKGDTWYLVDVNWMKLWKKYTGYAKNDQSSAGQRSYFPGPVETSSLFSTGTGNTLKDHLMEELDYSLVPEKAWKRLVQWYGLTPTSTPIARKVVEYDHHLYMHLKVEVFLLNFKLSMHPKLNKFIMHQFSREDTVGDLECVMRGLYSIPIETPCRIWHRCMSKLYELLDDRSLTIQDAGLYNMQTIIIEKQNTNGSWPSSYSNSMNKQATEHTDKENIVRNAQDNETTTSNDVAKEIPQVKLPEDDWLLKQQQNQHDELVESVTAEHKRANQASQRTQDALDRLARRERQILSLNKTLEENISEIESLGRSFTEEQERRVKAETEASKVEHRVAQLQQVTELLQTAEEGIRQRDVQIQSLEEERDVAINRIEVLENELCVGHQQQQETAQQLQTCQQQLQQAYQRADQQQQQVTIAETRLQHSDQVFQDMLQRLLGQLPQSQPHWVVQRNEIELTEDELGQGGWATVKVGIFRGNRVAAKCLHRQIVSAHNVRLFTREMSMAANARHPNLLQFIGATLDNQEPIILTELMPTSLRQVMEEGTRFTRPQIVSISHQVALALNYLHLTQPEAIIHRDVSSSNVLLDPLVGDSWRAKLSDYGSANFVRHITTAGPGNPTYSAPEANNPEQQSAKMDVFSFGVLLVEMCSGELAPADHRNHLLNNNIQWSPMVALIRQCLKHEPHRRPGMNDIITQLQRL